MVHRDIKLENVLVLQFLTPSEVQYSGQSSATNLDTRNMIVKIIDFGFASLVVPGKKLRVFCGTPSYMAPEIIQRREYGMFFIIISTGGYCVDIWALGILLYAMLYGQFPFRGGSDKEL